MSFEKLSIPGVREAASLLEAQLPKSLKIHAMCSLKLKGLYPTEDSVEFYAYKGLTKDASELFLIGTIEMKHNTERYSVIHCPDLITKEMLQALDDFYNWRKPQDFESISPSLLPSLEKLSAKHGRILTPYVTDEMYMSIEDALNLDDGVNAGFKIDRLSYSHGKIVNQHWRYGFEGGDVFLGREIECFGGFGCFVQNEECSSSQDPVCWVIRHHMGTLNALYTLPDYRRKGLASCVMKAAAKYFAGQGFLPTCETDDYNTESRRLLATVGFKISRQVYWASYKPPITI